MPGGADAIEASIPLASVPGDTMIDALCIVEMFGGLRIDSRVVSCQLT